MLLSVFYVVAFLFHKTIATCSPDCNEQFIGNYICDIECNNTYCDFDGGDCLNTDLFYGLNMFNSQNIYYMFDSNNGFNTGSCNLTNCHNLFFDDCNVLQTYTNKWCNFDNNNKINDICCAKDPTDCCKYDNYTVLLITFSLLILLIFWSCYGGYQLFSICCD